MRKHNYDNKDERTQIFRKIYLSFYSKGLRKVYVWGVSWRLNKDCNILTPTLLAIAQASQPGAWGPSLCWVWFSLLELEHWLQTLISNWSDFLSHPGYIIICRPPASCGITIRTHLHMCISHLTARPGRSSMLH